MQNKGSTITSVDEYCTKVLAMSGVSIMYWNAQGLLGKLKELTEFVRVENIDIVCISETHLTDKVKLKPIIGYNIIRRDRVTHLGGLLIIARDVHRIREIDCGRTTLLEYIAIVIDDDKRPIILNTYLPGGACRSDVKAYLKNDLNTLMNFSNSQPIIMLGDLNAKHKLWRNTINNAAGKILLDFVELRGHTIAFPPDPTYVPMTDKKKPSTIDLLITNGLIENSRPYVKKIFTSDHVPVFTTLHFDSRIPRRQMKVRDYGRANWKEFRINLNRDLIPIMNAISIDNIGEELIDKTIQNLTNVTRSAVDKSVPLVKSNRKGLVLSDEARRMISKRNYYRRRWLRTHRTEDKLNYDLLNKQTKQLITEDSQRQTEKIMGNFKVGDNKIYKTIRNRRRQGVTALYDNNNKDLLHDDTDKANILADHFEKMHDNPLMKNDLIFTNGVREIVKNKLKIKLHITSNTLISSREVFTTIKSLKNGKSPGPDGVTTATLKNFSYLGYEVLTRIYNECLTSGYFPSAWKVATTVAVPKPGKDPHQKTSYRPIALLSLFSKVFERLINTRVTEFNNTNNIIPDNQFGFRKGLSTDHALMTLYDNIKSGFTQKLTTGVISFDIEKAFDRVWQDGLVYKMIRNEYPDYLTYIVSSFIRQRTFRVGVGKGESRLVQAYCGLPQGSALSPALYNIYISDIPTNTVKDTLTLQYADDTLILTSDRLIAKINTRLQDASKVLIDFLTLWKIKTNPDKTALTCFTNRKTKQLPDDTLIINRTDVKWTNELKYLGVIFDTHLTMKTHINHVTAKADGAIRCLYPYINRQSQLPNDLKIHLYKTYIRPILTYAAPLTVNISKTTLQVLERKQSKCLRMLLNITWDSFTSGRVLEQVSGVDNITKHLTRIQQPFLCKCKTSDNKFVKTL